jgi:hypothetical protein
VNFRIEKILTINYKIYLQTRSLEANVNFKLSDNALLGGLNIENWYTTSENIGDNTNVNSNSFTFALKNETDKDKLKLNDILRLSNFYTTVVESFFTVSGKIGSLLESGTGVIEIGTILTDHEWKWEVIENNLPIGRQKDTQLRKRAIDNLLFLYFLKPINHSQRPKAGVKLLVTQNDG